MKRYSASGLKTYKLCKLKYDLYYNQEIKIDRPITSDTVFGQMIHEVAESYTGKNYKQVLEIVNKHKSNLDKEFKSLVPQTIENLFSWLDKYSKYSSVNEQELELKTDDYWIYGLADKLFVDKKMFADYKTAKLNNRDNHIFQMKLYNLILSKTWGIEPKEIKCIIYYLLSKIEALLVFFLTFMKNTRGRENFN